MSWVFFFRPFGMPVAIWTGLLCGYPFPFWLPHECDLIVSDSPLAISLQSATSSTVCELHFVLPSRLVHQRDTPPVSHAGVRCLGIRHEEGEKPFVLPHLLTLYCRGNSRPLLVAALLFLSFLPSILCNLSSKVTRDRWGKSPATGGGINSTTRYRKKKQRLSKNRYKLASQVGLQGINTRAVQDRQRNFSEWPLIDHKSHPRPMEVSRDGMGRCESALS